MLKQEKIHPKHSIGLNRGLIVKRNVAFVKRDATIVNETQVCKIKCTVCKQNATIANETQGAKRRSKHKSGTLHPCFCLHCVSHYALDKKETTLNFAPEYVQEGASLLLSSFFSQLSYVN